jgi:hypothetical protein
MEIYMIGAERGSTKENRSSTWLKIFLLARWPIKMCWTTQCGWNKEWPEGGSWIPRYFWISSYCLIIINKMLDATMRMFFRIGWPAVIPSRPVSSTFPVSEYFHKQVEGVLNTVQLIMDKTFCTYYSLSCILTIERSDLFINLDVMKCCNPWGTY